MVKHVVLSFFGMLLLVGAVLLVVQASRFGSISGFATTGSIVEENEDTFLRMQQAYHRGDFVHVQYALRSLSGEAERVSVGYELLDAEERVLSQGSEQVIIDSREFTPYGLKLAVSASLEPALVHLRAIQGVQSNVQDAEVKRASLLTLTGASVGTTRAAWLSRVAWISVALFIVAYLAVVFVRKRRYQRLAEGIDGRFIELRDLAR